MTDKIKIVILRNEEGSWEGVYNADKRLITEGHSTDLNKVLEGLGFESVVIYRDEAWFAAHNGVCPPILDEKADKIAALINQRDEYAEAEVVAQERRREIEDELRELGVSPT